MYISQFVIKRGNGTALAAIFQNSNNQYDYHEFVNPTNSQFQSSCVAAESPESGQKLEGKWNSHHRPWPILADVEIMLKALHP